MPGNFLRAEQGDFQAFFACAVIRADQSPAVKKVYLINVGDADHGEGGIDRHSGSTFFQCFAEGALGSGFTVFHEAGRKRPEATLRFNGAPAKQDHAFPFGDATDNQSGVFVVYVTTCAADVPRQ